jgi:NADH-quinone oxidoreductase subunit J
MVSYYHPSETHPAKAVLAASLRPTSDLRDAAGNEKPNVAGLGEALYADHLVTVELAGSLLFVALIAAVLITNPGRPIRPGETSGGNGAPGPSGSGGS